MPNDNPNHQGLPNHHDPDMYENDKLLNENNDDELEHDDDEELEHDDDEEEEEEEEEEDFIECDPSGRYARYNEILGRGAEKTVYRAYDKLDCKEVAWNKTTLTSSNPNHNVLYEIELLQNTNHRGILKLFASWIDPQENTINFITELCSSSLFNYRKKHKHLSKKALAWWGTQILMALSHLHQRSPPIIHRDLKCENILVKSSSGMALKIGDFGLATPLDPSGYMHNMPVGTLEFMAPEMFSDDYNELVDVYSFGMCMIQLITREYPYSECKNLAQVYRNVSHGVMPDALYRIKDEQAANFIKRCLLPIAQRPSAMELMSDPFLKCQEGSHKVISYMKRSSSAPTFPMLNGLKVSADKNTFGSQENLAIPARMSKVAHEDREIASIQRRIVHDDCGKQLLDRKSSFRVMGKVVNEHTLHLKVRIEAPSKARAIVFPFDLREDSPRGVAEEMVRALNYPESDLIHIANLISEEVAELSMNRELAACAHVVASCLGDVQKLQTIHCR